MTRLALSLAHTNKERHEKVEYFFLVNDSATIATEVPIYLMPSELAAVHLPSESPITGYIDILQVRASKVHIMDYKPGARTDGNAASQLLLYALALRARTDMDPKDIVCAYFDENDYYQFTFHDHIRRFGYYQPIFL